MIPDWIRLLMEASMFLSILAVVLILLYLLITEWK
jgi:hypothetical protein